MTATTPADAAPLQRFNCCASVSVYETMNPTCRKTMEDTVCVIDSFLHNPQNGFFGVYDGHGGRDVAVFLQRELHKRIAAELTHKRESTHTRCNDNSDCNTNNDASTGESGYRSNGQADTVAAGDATIAQRIERAFLIADVAVCRTCRASSGSTAVVTMLLSDAHAPPHDSATARVLYTANVGDSRAVLSHNGRAVRLSTDHKADAPDEVARIVNDGGFVLQQRVSGVLAVARSFGDRDLKAFVSARPSIVATRLVPMQDYPFVILACDGVWDEVSDQEAVDLITAVPTSERERAAQVLVEAALARGSSDNITAVVVFF